MTHIFLSYDPADRDFVAHLARQFRHYNLTNLIDSDSLRQRKDGSHSIDRSIEESSAVIVVLTPYAKVSESVTYEWAFALGVKKLVIPLLLEPTELHPRLAAIPVLDFTGDPLPWDELINQVRQAEIEYSANKVVDALRDQHWETRMVAAEILGQKGDPLVVPALGLALNDQYLEVRIAAAEALSKIGSSGAVGQLVEALSNNETEVRITAAWALGKIKDPVSVPSLVKALRDSNTRIRWNAAWALGEIGIAAVPGLVEALRDKDGRVRGTAAGALAAIGVSDAVPGLIEALQDEKWTVREAAARALGQLEDPAAVHGLAGALYDNDDRVRSTAASALAAIGGPALPGLIEALRTENSGVRVAAAGALGTMAFRAHKSPIPGLFEVLNDAMYDSDSSVRSVSAWALGELGPEAVPVLSAALRDQDSTVRAAALRALMRINSLESRQVIAQWQNE